MQSKETRTILLKIFFANFMDMLAFGIFIPILPFLFSTEDTSLFRDRFSPSELTLWYGWLAGGYSLAVFIGSPLLGALSDRFGRKKLLIFAHIINIIAYLIVGWGVSLANLFLLFAGRIFSGLMGGSLITVQSSIADISTPETKAQNFGITGVAFGLGFVVGVTLTVGLTQLAWFTFPMAFILSAVITFLNLLFIVWFLPETLREVSHKTISLWTGFQNVYKAFTEIHFRLIFIIIFILTFGFSFFTQFFQFYLIDKFDYDVSQVGLIFVYIGLLIAFVQGVLLPVVARLFSAEKVLLVSILAFAITFLLILVPQQAYGLWLILPIMLFFQGVTFPTILAVVSNMVDESIQGETLGINQSIQALANALPPIIFGFAVGIDTRFPMVFAFACILVSWLLYVRFYRIWASKRSAELVSG